MNTSKLDLTTKKILSGKPVFTPTWELKLVVTPLISIANDIFSADTHFKNFSHTMYPADSLQLDIDYDGNTIDSLHFLNNQTQERRFKLADEYEKTDHAITFKLSGKNENHSHHTDTNDDVSWIFRIDLYIEQFFVSGLFLESGNADDFFSNFYLGENGTRVLKIQTPIYRWLFQHESSLLRSVVNHKNSPL
jgi:hypothetical protein